MFMFILVVANALKLPFPMFDSGTYVLRSAGRKQCVAKVLSLYEIWILRLYICITVTILFYIMTHVHVPAPWPGLLTLVMM